MHFSYCASASELCNVFPYKAAINILPLVFPLQLQKITDEGIKFRQRYHVEDFPAIIIIDPRTGERSF